MRRLFAIVATVALAAAMVPAVVSADTSGGCFGATQCRFSGQGVDGSWSSVPATGPVIGQTYTDTYVAASTSMTATKGVKAPSGGLWFQQFSYVFDGPDNKPVPISESFVTDFGPDLVVSVDGKLRVATVSGTVMVVSCTITADYSETCGEPVATVVRGTWTAIAPAYQVSTTYHAKGPGTNLHDSYQGTSRQATAVVSIGGTPVPGLANWASIQTASGHSIQICHAPAVC